MRILFLVIPAGTLFFLFGRRILRGRVQWRIVFSPFTLYVYTSRLVKQRNAGYHPKSRSAGDAGETSSRYLQVGSLTCENCILSVFAYPIAREFKAKRS